VSADDARITTAWVVRHGSAGDRAKWRGDDRLRPLDERGQRQAQALLAALTPHEVGRARSVLSSPYLRCRQTVEPLDAALGLEVVDEPALVEGGALRTTLQLLRRCGDAVLCTHGDIVADLVLHLVHRGLVEESEARWPKASTWVVEQVGGRFSGARYVPPPKA
jgi:8-oxo-dGTP diphosphatase